MENEEATRSSGGISQGKGNDVFGEHRIRCPVCNKFGSAKNKWNRCRKCEAEGLMPKCLVSSCNNDIHTIGGRFCKYCKDHHYGDIPALRRTTFDEKKNDALKGWNQPAAETYGIVRDTFPAED